MARRALCGPWDMETRRCALDPAQRRAAMVEMQGMYPYFSEPIYVAIPLLIPVRNKKRRLSILLCNKYYCLPSGMNSVKVITVDRSANV